MIRTASIVGSLALSALIATPVGAQPPTPPPAPASPASPASQTTMTPSLPASQTTMTPATRRDLRNQIFVMEGALQRAVQFGARQLNHEVRAVVPNIMLLSGEPHARGVYLDGYGIIFDVGVPVLLESMVWSLGPMLRQDDEYQRDLQRLRADAAKLPPGPQRALVENLAAQLESMLRISRAGGGTSFLAPQMPERVPGSSLSGAAMGVATRGGVSDPPAPKSVPQSEVPQAPQGTPPSPALEPAPPVIDRKYLQDPNAIHRAYTESVQNALIDAIIDYSVMRIRPEEWITVAARDNMHRDSLAPQDPFEEVVTILISIKGADLAAYRAGQIDRDEVRRRVQVGEF